MNAAATETLGPIQRSLYLRLTGDATLTAMLGTAPATPARGALMGVYDGAPEGAPFPYVTLGEAIETPRNAHAVYGAETVVTLHVWSKQRGYSEGLGIAGRLRQLLDHQLLDVVGHDVIAVRHEQTLTLRDPNPELRHLPVRFRITTEQE